jgi:hypothetical protein
LSRFLERLFSFPKQKPLMFSATTTENIKGFLTIARGRVRTKTNWRSLSSLAAVRVAGENSCLPSPRPFEYLYTKVAGKKAVAAFKSGSIKQARSSFCRDGSSLLLFKRHYTAA